MLENYLVFAAEDEEPVDGGENLWTFLFSILKEGLALENWPRLIEIIANTIKTIWDMTVGNWFNK